MDIKSQILALLNTQKIEPTAYTYWKQVLDEIPEKEQENILGLFQTEPDAAELFTQNLVSKIQTLENEDLEQWSSILEEDSHIPSQF